MPGVINPSQGGKTSAKHAIIDKANTTMLMSVAGAIFVVVFSVFAAKALIEQSSYQNEVINQKQEALKIAEQNHQAAQELETSYIAFATEPINVLGGSPTGSGPKDGDNAELVLDSLPSELDYPAGASSIEKILLDGGFLIKALGGSESVDAPAPIAPVDETAVVDETTGEEVPTDSTLEVTVAEVPYPFEAVATPETTPILLQILESSIRPFNITSLTLEADGTNIILQVSMKTFYQSGTSLQVTKEEVPR